VNPASERSIPFWSADEEFARREPLDGGHETEVLVVGSGIAGLSTAYELASAGKRVTVVDRGPLCGGMSARTTAHLASAWDDRYHAVIDTRSVDEARLLHASQAAAIDRIEQIVAAEQISCDFARVDGYLCGAGDDEQILKREIDACHAIGFAGVEWSSEKPLAAAGAGRCLRFPGQGRFHPGKYLAGLVQAIERLGGRCFANTPITHVEEEDAGVTAHLERGGTVRAKGAVIATNSPITSKLTVHAKQAPYRTYAVSGRMSAGGVMDALIWDTLDPYHYVRTQPVDAREVVLIVGGEDHKSGEAWDMTERFAALEAWTRRHFPRFGAVEHRWSGQVYEPVDSIPFIGRDVGQSNIYIATGDSGQGMTSGVLAGMLLCDLVAGRENPWAELYDPARKSARALGALVRENVTAVKQFAKFAAPGEVSSLDEVRPGQAAIVRSGLQKIAAYRSDSGRLYAHAASCTHAGCQLEWNPFERCWDCPCHGSQFAPNGEVLNGPAVHPLKPAE
jgi:glycine/D-amino acid oxidase-like deaminating enzyme/nitrite reductase/ring-hydroxylating ferredoxin subunit